MKMILKMSACIVISLILGIGSAIAIMAVTSNRVSEQNGVWRYIADAGSVDADMYSRAIIARIGLLALNRSETIYFSAFEDSSGEILQENCQYELAGISPPARWWSLTAYGEDHFLIPNPDKLYAHTASSLKVSEGEKFNIKLSPTRVDGAWIPTLGSGNPNLIFRLYNPEGDAKNSPQKLYLPSITKGECK
jgi:hypothetical protein